MFVTPMMFLASAFSIGGVAMTLWSLCMYLRNRNWFSPSGRGFYAEKSSRIS